ncbi:OLC1v1031615C1 [Oldenlandia corymbosa var. corymbosa]|uniref:OLC1v1031615C1 n=1 Tax=Oldenlandia corymbosa var. corymbosa TaxID=529605 RepID=A0AAV1CJU0_OLDCO|nr:OLC1v1031615C1 [Oldenlandia corymbosa var. corymbosa]
MDVLVNGEVSDGSGTKRSLDNGCSSNSGNATKFKVRKVSATRGFPLMCGQDFRAVKSESKENVMSSGHKHGGNHLMMRKDATQDLANFDVLHDVGRWGNVAGGPEPSRIKNATEVKVQCSEVCCLINGEVSTQEASIPSPKIKFRRRRISATRDFPEYRGSTTFEQRVDRDEKLKATFSRGVNNHDKGNGVEALKASADSISSLETLTGKVEKYPPEKLRTTVESGDPLLMATVELSPSREKLSTGHDHSTSRTADNVLFSRKGDNHVIVNALMAATSCPRRQDQLTTGSGGSRIGSSSNQVKITGSGNLKAVAKKSIVNAHPGKRSLKGKEVFGNKHYHSLDTFGSRLLNVEGESGSVNEGPHVDPSVDVSLPPFGPSAITGDVRNQVREILRLFQAFCRKLLQGEESTESKQKIKRIDIEASKQLIQRGKEVNTEKKYLGSVPGVEVGDEFQYRVELVIVGIHRPYQGGIDSMDSEGKKIAISIVASGGYDDDMENPDVVIYSGQGGLKAKDKQPEDQKLEKGNLALFNSISTRNPVRVIRGSKEKDIGSQDSKAKIVTKYVYDGLYTVEKCWREAGNHGKLVFMFELRRMPGQPEIAWKEVKTSKKGRPRHGVCVDDISGGKESSPICAVNTIDKEKPQPFIYTKKIMYPDSLHPRLAKGCDCIGRCSDPRRCACAMRNGEEIPYNHNGAIVEVKPLVYECGPHCKCSASCYNRVSQHGIKLHLEIFKTKSRGWGVRSLSSISPGTFICEYVGEIIKDREAEKRAGKDEYLFDIGQNYSDLGEGVEEGGDGYTIDAAKFGNVGRFINHSCSPNLYAQNVLYDHDDKRVPHIMLFAAENIPPLHELTYHYNYVVDQVYDLEGNIKVKRCFCGASGCTGRMY